MTALTTRERRIVLATMGRGDLLASVLLSDDGIDREVSSCHGGTLEFEGESRCFQVDAKGIRFGSVDEVHGGTGEIVRWSALRAHRAALPGSVLDALGEARAERTEHWCVHPVFEVSAEIRSDQVAVEDARAAFHRDLYMPWFHRLTVLTRTLNAAVDAAFPGDEPADLLEMVAALEGAAA